MQKSRAEGSQEVVGDGVDNDAFVSGLQRDFQDQVCLEGPHQERPQR